MAIPLRGDRSAWDMNYKHLHASDIENEEFLNHVPTSGSSSEGFILHSSGSGWISSDEIIIPVAIKKVSATPSNPDSGYVKFYAKTNDKFYALDSSGNETEFESSGSSAGVYYFTDLLDAPGSYTDQAGKVIAVNETEDGLEFVVQTSGSSSTTFLALTDTPANYTGAGGKILAVKSSVDGIEFIDAPTSGSDTTAIHDNESGEINAITTKIGLHDNDVFIIEDFEASYAKKKIARSDLYPTWLTYLQADFTDNAGKVVAVNSGEDAFELVTPTSGSGSGAESFTDLDDVPSAYTDQAGKVLAVNSGETALEFVTPTSGSGGGAIGFSTTATSGSGTYTWNLANGSTEIEIDGNTVIDASNLDSVEGFVVFIKITKNDPDYTVKFDTDDFWFVGGVQPVLSSGSGIVDILTFACDGTYLYNIAVVKNLSDEFSPTGISNLAVWLDADDISGSNNDPISTWADKSGNDNDFSSEDNSRRPLLKTSSINGHKSLLFDNSDDSLVSSYEIDQKAYSLFIVAKAYDSTSGYHKILTQGGWWDFGHMDGDKVYTYNWDEYQSSSGLASSTFLISHYQNNGGEGASTGEFRVNGSTVASRTDFSYPNDPLMIGRYDEDQANAYVAEIIIYEKELSSAELAAVELYLITKYGIS